MSFWRNYVKMTSFWRNNDVIIAWCVCWDVVRPSCMPRRVKAVGGGPIQVVKHGFSVTYPDVCLLILLAKRGLRFNIKMFFQNRKSHCGDKIVVKSSPPWGLLYRRDGIFILNQPTDFNYVDLLHADRRLKIVDCTRVHVHCFDFYQ